VILGDDHCSASDLLAHCLAAPLMPNVRRSKQEASLIGMIVLALVHLETTRPLVPTELRAPAYPDMAVKAVMTGVVEVEDTIDSSGAVTAARVTGEPAYSGKIVPLLGAAAIDAAREWKFNADPDPAARRYVIRFEFSVDREAAWKGDCTLGSPLVTFLPLSHTVRVRGRFRPQPATVLHDSN
jgi:TonB family protein